MAARAPTKRETWADWVDDMPEADRLLSRDDLVDQVREFGVDVTANDIRYWEYEGILPQGVKRWRDGANRVFYPLWMVGIVVSLRELQKTGFALRDIAPILREKAKEFAEYADTYERLKRGEDGLPPTDRIDRSFLLTPATWMFADALLAPELANHAERVQRLTGKQVGHIRLEVRDTDGKPIDGGTYILRASAEHHDSDAS